MFVQSLRVAHTIVRLPEVDESPIKPDLSQLRSRTSSRERRQHGGRGCSRGSRFGRRSERRGGERCRRWKDDILGREGSHTFIFSKSGHSPDKRVDAETGEDRVDCRPKRRESNSVSVSGSHSTSRKSPPCNLSCLPVELVADTQQKRTQARNQGILRLAGHTGCV
jgi:hypothetical protein